LTGGSAPTLPADGRQIINCREAADVEFAHGLPIDEAEPVHAAYALMHGFGYLLRYLRLRPMH
jgi:hypothetical protein